MAQAGGTWEMTHDARPSLKASNPHGETHYTIGIYNNEQVVGITHEVSAAGAFSNVRIYPQLGHGPAIPLVSAARALALAAAKRIKIGRRHHGHVGYRNVTYTGQEETDWETLVLAHAAFVHHPPHAAQVQQYSVTTFTHLP